MSTSGQVFPVYVICAMKNALPEGAAAGAETDL